MRGSVYRVTWKGTQGWLVLIASNDQSFHILIKVSYFIKRLFSSRLPFVVVLRFYHLLTLGCLVAYYTWPASIEVLLGCLTAAPRWRTFELPLLADGRERERGYQAIEKGKGADFTSPSRYIYSKQSRESSKAESASFLLLFSQKFGEAETASRCERTPAEGRRLSREE